MAEETWEMSCTGHTQSAAAGDDDNEGKKNASYIGLCAYQVGTANGELFLSRTQSPRTHTSKEQSLQVSEARGSRHL